MELREDQLVFSLGYAYSRGYAKTSQVVREDILGGTLHDYLPVI
jgi:hypothetical protein